MTKEELLKELSNLSEEDLKALLEAKKNKKKEFVPHEDLNETFLVINWNNNNSHIENSFEGFEKCVRSLLKKTPYGVQYHNILTKETRTLDYGKTPDEVIEFVKQIFAEMSENASLGTSQEISLFNSRDEEIWFLVYENDVINNLSATADAMMGTQPRIIDYMMDIEKMKGKKILSEELFKEINNALKFIMDHFYFKENETSSRYNLIEDTKERDQIFNDLSAFLLTYQVMKKNENKDDETIFDPLMNVLNIILRRYRYQDTSKPISIF